MPTVSVSKSLLYEKLGKQYTDEEFEELCFQFGIEVDDIVEDPEKGTQLKIEVGANRYDLLCVEGLALALNLFNKRETLPVFKVLPNTGSDQYKIFVKPDTKKVRPYIVGAILRDVTLTKQVYDSFIDLQEKLQQNIGRKRSLVAIGTHDLDTISGPFTYTAEDPKKIDFVALNRTKSMTADKLMEELATDLHLREYLPIIKDKPLYPVIRDKNGVVLSMPPIINGEHSKISLKTKNILIECTGTDLFRTKVVLDTIICMFSGYCAKKFTANPIEVICDSTGTKKVYPELSYRTKVLTPHKFNLLIGSKDQSACMIASHLNRMGLKAQGNDAKKNITVEIGPLRYDILHEMDIVNDFCVSYGYDKLSAGKKLPATCTIGNELELNYLSDKVRMLLAQNNFTEAATFTLCSKSDLTDRLRLSPNDVDFVKIGNPKTIECEAMRNTLLPGLIRTVASNKHMPLPIRMFEVADIVLKDSDPERTKGVGARNERHLCALNYNVKPGLEVIHGLLDNIMVGLRIPEDGATDQPGYYLVEKNHPSYFPGWAAAVMIGDEEVGQMGAIHPDVITNFNLSHPGAALTLNLQRIFDFANI